MALVRAIEAHASQLGRPAIYLNAPNSLTPFYEALGWRVVERAYGAKHLNVMQRLLKFDCASGQGQIRSTGK